MPHNVRHVLRVGFHRRVHRNPQQAGGRRDQRGRGAASHHTRAGWTAVLLRLGGRRRPCDFRKLGGFEAYCVSDNVSELTARVNDDGWDRAYADWLTASRLNNKDCLVVFSVGGGDEVRGVSPNLVNAMLKAREVGAGVTGVVGRDGGALRRLADASILVPVVVAANVTAQAEAMQALMWHLMIMHPDIARATPKWESMDLDPPPPPTPHNPRGPNMG
ncbi:MAG: hypothetical protein NVSMB32_02830 [Actinomycetota bacterium]